MVSREGYYDYIIRRHREEDAKTKSLVNRNTERPLEQSTIITIMRKEIIEMQKSIHHMQMRIKKLAEDNYRLKEENANLHNNKH